MSEYIPHHLSRLLVKSPGHAARIILDDAEITVWMLSFTEAILMVEKEGGASILYRLGSKSIWMSMVSGKTTFAGKHCHQPPPPHS